MSWRGVVEWRRAWARAVEWGAGIELLDWYGRSPSLVTAGYGLELVEIGLRASDGLELENWQGPIGARRADG